MQQQHVLKDPLDNLKNFFEFGMSYNFPYWIKPDFEFPVLHLGNGNKKVGNTVELDWPAWDAETGKLPYEDNSIGGIFSTHFFEHLTDPRPLLEECLRVLHPGCALTTLVPHGQSLQFLHDFDHKTPFVIDSWKNWLNNNWYSKGKMKDEEFFFTIGVNITMATAERNTVLITQLIKEQLKKASNDRIA